MEVSQLPMMTATARVNAIRRIVANKVDIPFIVPINNWFWMV
jgi:hypothetical protein